MVKRWKRQKQGIGILLLMIGFCMILSVTCAAQYHLRDDAFLFSDGEVQKIEALAAQIEEQYGMNVFVMTCEDAKGKESREVLEDTYEQYGLESNEAKGGIAYMIDMDHRELNLVTDRDMIYYITDKREEAIYDAAWDAVSEGAYGEAMLDMLEETMDFLRKGIPENQYTFDEETGKVIRYRSLTQGEVLAAFLAALLTAGGTATVIARTYKKGKTYRYAAAEHADVAIQHQNDMLVNHFTTHRIIENTSDSGDDGHTTTHHSSSGHTYGGGSGRKF